MGNSETEVLLIFIKNQQMGQVKTRLAETIGNQQAFKIYQKLLALTRSVTDQLSCHRQLWYSQHIDNNDDWDASSYEKKIQQGDNLGQRMSYAFSEAFSAGFERAVIIGSDCAELQPRHVRRAFTVLEYHDIAIGPSQDGGYYLLGMNAFYPQLFAEINWSTSSVFKDTINRIKTLNLTHQKLPMLNDIDTEEDLRESGRRLQDI